jgi:uncharacterized membrane protein YadS
MQNQFSRLLPGLLLCVGVTLLADVLQMAEQRLTGQAYVEALVLAILIGVAALRSLGLIPAALLAPTAFLANVLTTVFMAALGLGVDVRVVARAGLRVSAAVTLSLIVLGAISLGLIHVLAVA